MKRRGFIVTLFGAFAAPALPLQAVSLVKPVPDHADLRARWERYCIAVDWPHDQRRMDFIVKGEITGFTHGWCWTGPAWHKLDRPMKIGDIVNVRRPVSMIAQARKSDGHIFFDFGPERTEAVTLTPEFLKTNGFPMPTIDQRYRAGRISSDDYGFKRYKDETLTPELVTSGWADPANLPIGTQMTISRSGNPAEQEC